MSAGDLDNRMPTESEAHTALGSKFDLWLRYALAQPVDGIDYTWDIPFLCGINKNGTCGYVHRALVKIDHDPTDFEVAMAHEKGELNLVKAGWKYGKAHRFGNFAEQQNLKLLEKDETYAAYNARIESHANTVEDLPILRCPPDLALYPYASSGALMAKIRYAQRHPKG